MHASSSGCCWKRSRGCRSPTGGGPYLRLSTTPIAQEPFAAFAARVGDEAARADVVAGGFRLREPRDRPTTG